MIASDAAAVDNCRAIDGDGNSYYEQISKKRNLNNTNARLASRLSTSVTSATSLSLSDTTDDDEFRLPKRVVALNIVRPVPKRISEQFYDDAYRKGFTLRETNQAAMMAHDWNRKWRDQDETYHTMPEEDFYRSSAAVVPASYCHGVFSDLDYKGGPPAYTDADIDIDQHQAANGLLLLLEREEGAKNPSLGSPEEGKRKRYASRTAEVRLSRHHSITEQQKQHNQPSLEQWQLGAFNKTIPNSAHKGTNVISSTEASTWGDSSMNTIEPNGCERCHSNATEEKQDNEIFSEFCELEQDDKTDNEPGHNQKALDIQRPLPLRPMPIRPLAIRANRSRHIVPQPTYAKLSPFAQESRNGSTGRGIPRGIVMSHSNRAEGVSPMSFSQLTGSSPMSSGSEMMGVTVINSDHENLHYVEDDDLFDIAKDSAIQPVNMIEKARDDILRVLAISDGDSESEDFKKKVDPLEKHFLGREIDTRAISVPSNRGTLASSASASSAAESINGMWLTLSKPNFFGKLGQNDNGDPMYTLGRMSFDMFSPTNLVCSLQGNFNHVEIVDEGDRKAMLEKVPKKLREEVESGKTTLRTYHVVTAFTIEPSLAAYPNAPNKDVMRPIKGIMTTYGYSLPDPSTPNRHSVWFTGGRIEPNNDKTDVLGWNNFFQLHPPKHSFTEKAKLLAVKLLMGATIPTEVDPVDGSFNYVFTRPLGGHGMVYIDVIYLDESLRIVRGQRGTTFVFSRVPDTS